MDRGSYRHIGRNQRQASSTFTLQKEVILRFCHSDDSSTIDSNSKNIVEVKTGDIVEKHLGRVWVVSIIDKQYSLFVESEIVGEYTSMYRDSIRLQAVVFFTRTIVHVLLNQPNSHALI